jgi:multisubunit Na+/H+ antiporter MnhF subunit
MKDRKFSLLILFFILIHVILRLSLIQHIPNPVIPDGILALDMVLPIIAGILFGLLAV